MSDQTSVAEQNDASKTTKVEDPPVTVATAGQDDPPKPEPEDLSLDDALKVHASFREKSCHEDGSINQRKTWLVLSQTFLIGALVLLLSNAKIVTEYEFLIELIVWVGLISSFSACVGILAAHLALFGTRGRYEDYPGINLHKDQLPAMLGGGTRGTSPKRNFLDRLSVALGLIAGFMTPVVLVLAWTVAANELGVRPFGPDVEAIADEDTSASGAEKPPETSVKAEPDPADTPKPEGDQP